MMVLFLATRFGEIAFDDCLVDIEEPLRDFEVLHGLIFQRTCEGNLLAEGFDCPVYFFTGRRAEYRRPKTFKSRGERAGKMTRLQFDGE